MLESNEFGMPGGGCKVPAQTATAQDVSACLKHCEQAFSQLKAAADQTQNAQAKQHLNQAVQALQQCIDACRQALTANV